MLELLPNNEVGVTERPGSSPDTSTVTVGKAPFISPSALPVLEAAFGIRFDFNQGARVSLPLRADGKWRIRLQDLDTGNVIFASENAGAFVRSSKRYYVRFAIEISEIDEKGVEYPVFSHSYDARAQQVVIQFPIGTLGDTLAWFPYAARFSERHGAHVTCVLSGLIIPLLRDAYPQLNLVTPEEAEEHKLIERAYATYCLGLFFDDKDNNQQPTDFRFVGLHRTAGYILGVNPAEEAAQLVLPDSSRPIPEPYVCIAVQSSAQCKYWNNPGGWSDLTRFLKNAGYRVICIDQKPIHGSGIVWNHIPHGAEDETGNQPLSERARWLHHAAFFVGLSSGLSWLAWAARTPVVLISGFTHPTNEFQTPFRIINWYACNSCWNDPALRFDHHDFLQCPRHAGTPRQFECTRLITAQQVISAVKTIPAFVANAALPSHSTLSENQRHDHI
ncbi:autotransporter strand-loop-strand O-heptosyltransferase [Gluconobacter sphaericus]|uniref:Autotransporter strand-loop-strand O-heptosyltransferase n=1 Tax=Gluconobacter sphaericus NBRC 12467 TaxID=1307951 RepID=A0AA37SHP3_9PROT|nr:autotransporter strand-loop-strand O-heptosyltransferase [Gluconobacter sphaericus]MBF0886810.1 autotransporter strand-loop-strand O-heptosyltransferase [Gluconobacter sphaericus]MBS1086800.1 autotransporter strand-loop-strand O-heptosyltransferase [Gluconobacter sphaericus]MBS1100649.1 autotransporter strand-loop-strand O-heptosyltransferase [Gluconobacter sphaericus]GBR55399.1 glycosyltransferase [Gluconobacter sphaericus NBRC 12467]GEB43743.1 autotransporter strand-loop-strand O-heptosyl